MELPGALLSPSSKNFILKKISYTFSKKSFSYILKIHFKKVLIFREKETRKIPYISGTEISYISEHGNPIKLLLLQEVTFRTRKNL